MKIMGDDINSVTGGNMTKEITYIQLNGGGALSKGDQFLLRQNTEKVKAIVLSKRGRCIDVQTTNGPLIRYSVDDIEEIRFRQKKESMDEVESE